MEFTKPNGKRRVVITGAGMISGLGQNWDEAYEQLKSYKNCVKNMEDWHDIKGMNTQLVNFSICCFMFIVFSNLDFTISFVA